MQARRFLTWCAMLATCFATSCANATTAPAFTPQASSALPLAGDTTDASDAPLPQSASTRPFGLLAFGGFEGEHFRRHKSGDAFEYSEDVAIVYDHPIDKKSFSYTITPATPSSIYFGNKKGTAPTITVRKTPGTRYTLTVAGGVSDTAGNVLSNPLVYTFTSDATAAIPAPAEATLGEPYRYGVLEHPFAPSLAGPTAAQQIAALAGAGARFVRIDYCGSQSEPASGSFDFKTEDAIMDKLAAVGITELPIVEQYCAPAWAANGSTAATAFWSTPEQYAAFAGAVAAHVAAKYRQIKRIELFNEPNLAYWWQAPAPNADPTGSGTAIYMQHAYLAIKRAAPDIAVVGPALSDGGTQFTDPRTFLQNMYQAGCHGGNCWDILSVHNYRWMNPLFASRPYMPQSYSNRFDIYKDLQSIAVRNRDPKPHVMLTEWADSTSPTDPNGFDPAVQAQYIAIAFNAMLADPTVDGIVYTNIYNPATDFWGLTSLETNAFSPLPGYAVYHDFASQ